MLRSAQALKRSNSTKLWRFRDQYCVGSIPAHPPSSVGCQLCNAQQPDIDLQKNENDADTEKPPRLIPEDKAHFKL